ncbi:hypothetical protein JCM6882_008399 [Rhodosporidiobolus microsporus]
MENAPPPSPTSTFPFLPLELQIYILRLSASPSLPSATAQAELFSSVTYDLREDGDAAKANDRLAEKTAGLRAIGVRAKRLTVQVDNGSELVAGPSSSPWSMTLAEDNARVPDLRIEVSHADGGSRLWLLEPISSLLSLPDLPSLTVVGPSTISRIPADQFLPTRNLTRLVLCHVGISGWFAPDSFPSVRTLVVASVTQPVVPLREQWRRDFILPFPALESLAVCRMSLSTPFHSAFTSAPPTLKHVVFEFNPDSERAVAPAGQRPFPISRPHFPLHRIPHPLEALTVVPGTFKARQASVLADRLEEHSAAPCFSSLRRLKVPRAESWLDADNAQEVADAQRLVEWCARRGVELVRWTEEEEADWRVEEWRKEEDE